MSRFHWRVAVLGLAVAAACGEPQSLTRRAQPFAIAAVTYPGFSRTSGPPVDFKNACDDLKDVPAWLFPGNWYLLASVPGFSGPVLHQEETGGYPHIMIQRYAGELFGPDGQLPGHYTVSWAIQPFESPDRFPPVGENAVLVYYRDPSNYVEITVSNTNVSVWSSDQATPLSAEGWKDHFYYPANTLPGDIRRVACEVDTATQELTFWVEGQQAATVTIPLLTDAGYHGLALRSHGNQLNFGELQIVGEAAIAPPPLPPPPEEVAPPIPVEEPPVLPMATEPVPEADPVPETGVSGRSDDDDSPRLKADDHHPKGKALGYRKKVPERKRERRHKGD